MAGDDDSAHGDGFFPPPSKPRKVKGGIRAGTRRGAAGQTWWSRRWLAALEALVVGGRLARGRAYARQGQVISLEIEAGTITAAVQGTRIKPYAVRVEIATLALSDWLQLTQVLASQAVYRAKLLAGTMPDDIEAVFARAGFPLFPMLNGDLRMSCTCPDWAEPCKHVAAACHLVGEAFDRDPFLLFRLRGIERDVLLTLLAGHAARSEVDPSGEKTSAEPPAPTDVLDPVAFWGPVPAPVSVGDEPAPAPAPIDVQPPPADAPLIRVLGPLPLWRGTEDFETALQRCYRRSSSATALDVALGEPVGVAPRSR